MTNICLITIVILFSDLTMDTLNNILWWVEDEGLRYMLLNDTSRTIQTFSLSGNLTTEMDIAAMTVSGGLIIYSSRSTGKIYEVNIDGYPTHELKDGVVSVLKMYGSRKGEYCNYQVTVGRSGVLLCVC